MSFRKLFVTTSVALSLGAAPIVATANTLPTYTVKAGDSLWKISHKTGVSVTNLAQWNHVTNAQNLLVGTTLSLKGYGKAQTVSQHVYNAPKTNASSTTHTSETKVAQIISTAKKYIGVHYVWGGTTPSGFDCSGFTKYVFGQNGIQLPRNSRAQWNVGAPVPSSQLKKGDLVFFGDTYRPGVSHLGIYLGNDKFITASSSHGVTVSTLFNNPYWSSHYYGARSVI